MNPVPATNRTVRPEDGALARQDSAQESPPAPRLDSRRIRRGRIKLILLFLVCASPVIASYFTYYVIQPTGRTNYGELIDPQRSVLASSLQVSSGESLDWQRLRGKWVMATGYDGQNADDEASLRQRLYAIRQVRLTTGKDMDRIERVLLLNSLSAAPSADLLTQHEGLRVVRISATEWQNIWGQTNDRILMVDPLGNLMMRFPVKADPNKMKKDVSRLLRASRVG